MPVDSRPSAELPGPDGGPWPGNRTLRTHGAHQRQGLRAPMGSGKSCYEATLLTGAVANPERDRGQPPDLLAGLASALGAT